MYQLTQLTPDIYAYIHSEGSTGYANCGLIGDAQGATLIDTLLVPTMAQALRTACAHVGYPHIHTIINTHGHFDHVGGNACFPRATIWAHEKTDAMMRRLPDYRAVCQAAMPAWADELAITHIRMADRTFATSEYRLHIAGRDLDLLTLAGHTDADVAIWLPNERILFAGDVAFFGVTPLLLPEGNLVQWQVALDRLAALSCRVIVPGHGPPGTCADVDRLRDYLETVGRVARQSLGRGDTLEVAMQQFPLDRFAMWTEPERLRMNLFSAMRQLQGNHDPLSPQELIRVIHDAT